MSASFTKTFYGGHERAAREAPPEFSKAHGAAEGAGKINDRLVALLARLRGLPPPPVSTTVVEPDLIEMLTLAVSVQTNTLIVIGLIEDTLRL